jgi:adenosylmethionine-8-amino-7-oxononanoate aminotransferase
MYSKAEPGHLFPANVTDSFPVLVRGEGSYVWDLQGKRYLDGIAGIAVVNVGYGRAEIAEAIAEQAKALPYCAPNLFRNQPAMDLAIKLREFTPPGMNYVNFVSGGSEAVEVAIKLARQYQVVRGKPSKFQIISRWTSYHGATLGALSLTGHFGRREEFTPLLQHFAHIPAPYCLRCLYDQEYPVCNLRCAWALEEAIVSLGPDTVSAFIAEPIIGSTAGAVVPPDEYFPTIRAICDKYDVLLIADEVMTGFGRTGANFAMDHWGVVPDIMTVAKAISSGYAPLGATIVSEDIAEVFAEAGSGFDHVFTYSGNPVSLAAGLATLDIIQRENLVERASEHGAYFFRRAEALEAHAVVGDIRGKGLMMGIEFVKDRESKEPFSPGLAVYQCVVATALRNGLIVYPGQGAIDGKRGDNITLLPPLTISLTEIDEMIDILDTTITDVEAGLNR